MSVSLVTPPEQMPATPEPKLARWRGIVRKIFASDTIIIRFFMAMCSAGVACLLLWNAVFSAHVVMDRPAYVLFRLVGGDFLWACVFFGNALLLAWRIFTARSCVPCAVAVNWLNFFLWGSTTAALNYGVGFAAPFSGPEWVMLVFAGWVIVRTGLRDDITTP